jgi:hypothetical protein
LLSKPLVRHERTDTDLNSKNKGPKPPRRSEQSTFREPEGLAAGAVQVIEDSDVHELQRFAQAPSDELVGVARLGDA